MLLRRAVVLAGLLAGLVGCAHSTPQATPPVATRPPGWVFYTMEQQPGQGYSQYLWKPVGTPLDSEACRTRVRAKAERGPIAPTGLIAWYPSPGNPRLWFGCLPEGYDPYEPR